MKSYDHQRIEKKWQAAWAKARVYQTLDTVEGKDNFYLLVEFPYPSGNLHVGHWYAFAVPDMLARYLRMSGKSVLYPIGFDAFGLPAENAAIKNNLNPRKWTEQNIEYMKKQIASMGTSFDMSRIVSTIDPAYYKWTQWLFLQLFKAGLAYRKETAVNWCPKDKTVLANEQVIAGRCERCDSLVEQRQMLQWNLKITDYADRLIDDLAPLNWPNEIKESQRNWIGRSEGAEIDFYLDFGDPAINARVGSDGKQAHITVFTTRSDTLFGATYLVLAPEHPWITLALQHNTVLKNNGEVQAYVDRANKMTDLERQENKEKTGVKLEGIYAINPATNEKVPMYAADYVLGHYGTGAIMAVPAHDERDFEFAQKFDLPIPQVVAPIIRVTKGGDAVRLGAPFKERDAVMCIVKHWEKDEFLCIEWMKFGDIKTFVSGGIEEGEDAVPAGIREIQEETGYQHPQFVREIGQVQYVEFYHQVKQTNVRARMHYLYFELNDGQQAPLTDEENEKHTVVWKKRSEVRSFLSIHDIAQIWDQLEHGNKPYTGDGILINSNGFDGLSIPEAKKQMTEKFGRRKTTYKLRDWIVSRQRYWGVPIPIVHCEKCGPVAVEDKELPVLLPDVEDYLPTGDGKSPLAKVKSFVDTKCPKCGEEGERETDTLDTFVDSSWYFLRYTDPNNSEQFAESSKQKNWMPVDLYSGGAEHTTMHVLYSRFWHKALFDLGLVADSEPYTRRVNRSIILGPDGQKMSKSRGNVIDPDREVERLGADTVRMYLAFIGPYNEVGSYPWNPDGVVGVRRFLERLWRAQAYVQKDDIELLQNLLHKSIKKVGEDASQMKFNTAISQLMIFLNALEKEKRIGESQWKTLLTLIAPFAPYMAEELWSATGEKRFIHMQPWPEFDPKRLIDSEVTIAIQIDGKTRGEARVKANADKSEVEKAAREIVDARLRGLEVVKTIIVANRLINFVTKK